MLLTNVHPHVVGVVTVIKLHPLPPPSQPDLGETVSRLRAQLETAAEELDQQRRVNLALVRRQVCSTYISKSTMIPYTLTIVGGWNRVE